MGSQTQARLIRLTLHFIAARLPDPPLSTRKATEQAKALPKTLGRYSAHTTDTYAN